MILTNLYKYSAKLSQNVKKIVYFEINLRLYLDFNIDNMQLLQNKVALITGATRGIGRGIALSFAKNGANIAFTYVSSEEKAIALETELMALGIKAKGYKSDAGNFKAADDLVNLVVADFGTVPLPPIPRYLIVSCVRLMRLGRTWTFLTWFSFSLPLFSHIKD